MPFKVWGTMKLATKYDVAMLRTMIVRHFENEWPSTLVEWEKRRIMALAGKMRLTEREFNENGSLYTWSPDRKTFPEPVSAIHFAKAFNCPSVLPAAFYDLAQREVVLEWHAKYRTCASQPARWSSLGHEDLMRVVKGKNYLHNRFVINLDFMRQYVRLTCTRSRGNTDKDAASACVSTLDKLLLDHLMLAPCSDPLDTLRQINEALGDRLDTSKGAWCCSDCYVLVRRTLRDDAETMWDNLRDTFELEKIMDE